MIKIYSEKYPEKLLHVILRKESVPIGRQDVIDESNFLQCATLKLEKGTTFKPHKHLWKNKTYDLIAQESWVCINGSVKCFFYDLDDKLIYTTIINQGDCSFTLEGGHNYEIMEENTLVYEYKTGPYEGQKLDKIFI
jgi:cupin fold WbuC family metalloprotein